MRVIPIDFETSAIEKRPEYPPTPVGVALEIDSKPKYLSWGHPTGNNCTKGEATKILRDAFANHVCVFHNAAFDISTAMYSLGLPMPRQWEDTLFLAYINDPREATLALKPLAEKYLGMPPTERDMLDAWILENIYKGRKPTKADPIGAHIAEAPGELVGKYAVGDIVRTKKLFKFLYDKVKREGMLGAYEREKLSMPAFEAMSDDGLNISVKRLRADSNKWKKQVAEYDAGIRKSLRSPELNIDSGEQLADALYKTKKVKQFEETEKGARSTSRPSLERVCTDKALLNLLRLRGVLSTYISTFAEPWLLSAEKFDGKIFPTFNQTRTPDEGGRKSYGTRTGRPSSTNPNLLNVPRNQEDPLLPNLRDYIIPDDGGVLLIRDYNQQELRIAAHFEEGSLYRAYKKNPRMDVHEFVRQEIYRILGVMFDRSPVKVVNFGKIYGMGIDGLVMKLKCSREEAQSLNTAHGAALPDIKGLSKSIAKHCKAGNHITTWGGRRYFAEEPKLVNGQKRDYYYKMLNYLVQGSAADCTKEAMIRVSEAMQLVGGRLVLQVYDELVCDVPRGNEVRAMKLMREAMESIEFDIPMLSDGKMGFKSWGSATKYEDP